jgi:flavin-dependent dehydrogenase
MERPWSDFVEVYFDTKGEGVAKPVSDRSVAINFVWEDDAIERPTLPLLANRFPALKARLAGAPATSSIRGAGPMAQSARRRNADRMVLVGDAAGFVDSISGDGLSIAFNSALILGRHLLQRLAHGASRESMLPCKREARRLYRGYWFGTHRLLTIARHPHSRRMIIKSLGRHPRAFQAIMGGVNANDVVRGLSGRDFINAPAVPPTSAGSASGRHSAAPYDRAQCSPRAASSLR